MFVEDSVAGRPGESVKPGDRIVPLCDAFSNRTNEQYLYRGEAYVWQNMTDFVSFTVENDASFYNPA